MLEFEGQEVMITGGTGALGRAVVRQLLEGGARCVIPVYDDRELEGFPFPNHERVQFVRDVDLTSEADVARAFAVAKRVDASIHLAGGFSMSPIEATELSSFESLMRMNVTTCFLSCRAAARRMMEGGGGRIVNVSAKPALVPAGGLAAYAASKAAVAGLTLSLAEELADRGIWVNAIVPSIMDTPANRAAMPSADHSKWPSVDAVAETVTFLASRSNAVTRGALVPVYGQS
jgi:NAD(P)-dependent dehydrogenase (short-subunit alcohol dehydrogenase family)